jgi:hypothetical protein
LGAEKFTTVTWLKTYLHCADIPQKFKTLADRADTQAQAPDEDIHGSRLCLGKKKAINLPYRPRQAQDLKRPDEEVDGLEFKIGKKGRSISQRELVCVIQLSSHLCILPEIDFDFNIK